MGGPKKIRRWNNLGISRMLMTPFLDIDEEWEKMKAIIQKATEHMKEKKNGGMKSA